MLNYEVPAELLEPLVPAGVVLDRWHDRLYVSVIGFRFAKTRVLGVPVPGHRNFVEVNLRFYVRRDVGAERRRGVVFVRELVPRRAIAFVARLAYNEPYRALRMRSRVAREGDHPVRHEYGWQAGHAWATIGARASGPGRQSSAESEAAFITEHYWGYTAQRDGGTVEYRVEHPRWNVADADDARVDGDVGPVYGPAFAEVLAAPPRSAFVADGSAVTVFAPARIR